MAEEQSVSNVIAKTVDPLFSKTPYPEWAKMPEGYDFDTKGREPVTQERTGANSIMTSCFELTPFGRKTS